MGKKKEKDGAGLFDSYYKALYGDRWTILREALKLEKNTSIEIPGLQLPYYLDTASYDVASLLPSVEGMSVLDMCAAPGGKTLVIANKLKGNGLLVSNDRSFDRRERLKKVVSSSLSEELSSIIRITGYDASSWGIYERGVYDSVLLDAPCSSERHVINSEKHLSKWSPSRPKRLSIEQYAMLSSAFIAVKSGGYILYSTCSINPIENQGNILKLEKKHKEEFDIIDFELDESEKLERGRIILPDRANGKGPMYACLIKKR